MNSGSFQNGLVPAKPSELKIALKEEAEKIGFSLCGVSPVNADVGRDYFLKWIAESRHGDMAWMARNTERRSDPTCILPEAKSIICVGINYYQPEPDRRGRIAKYALGKDYHKHLMKKLKKLCLWLKLQGGINKPYIDTGPVMEKPLSTKAGLGWQGKNTMLIHTKFGNWLFIGEIFTTLEFSPDPPVTDHCGCCTACIDICPTQAITAPYQLDSRRCIAYLTIEHQGAIPLEFRSAIGNHLFGCDDCLDVCPWNRWAQTTHESEFEARNYPDLRDMLDWTDADFNGHFQNTPIHRLRRSRWLRNVCVVLGNIGEEEDLPALKKAAANPDPLVSEHAAWAVSRICDRFNMKT